MDSSTSGTSLEIPNRKVLMSAESIAKLTLHSTTNLSVQHQTHQLSKGDQMRVNTAGQKMGGAIAPISEVGGAGHSDGDGNRPLATSVPVSDGKGDCLKEQDTVVGSLATILR
eukprot:CAMPEP_0194744292 /NCGR_PEP_ID=MMETSP0296-20130528/100786_1 /TAXON_ID=39354 /ORGANISM="Heterosigma akashiwo, Strain CCMP2393" /LENGTH=112 /DNA_ID=CAMNT_0039656413 /DNA_START=966 /DNA_END=1304 /DNA_ORIENTATION=-